MVMKMRKRYKWHRRRRRQHVELGSKDGVNGYGGARRVGGERSRWELIWCGSLGRRRRGWGGGVLSNKGEAQQQADAYIHIVLYLATINFTFGKFWVLQIYLKGSSVQNNSIPIWYSGVIFPYRGKVQQDEVERMYVPNKKKKNARSRVVETSKIRAIPIPAIPSKKQTKSCLPSFHKHKSKAYPMQW